MARGSVFAVLPCIDKCAEKLIEKSRARAEALADDVEPPELRELLYYLVDSVLDRSCVPPAEAEGVTQLVQLGA